MVLLGAAALGAATRSIPGSVLARSNCRRSPLSSQPSLFRFRNATSPRSLPRAAFRRAPLTVTNVAQTSGESAASVDELVLDPSPDNTSPAFTSVSPSAARRANKAAVEAEAYGTKIWASPVKAKKQRPYWQREWNSTDIKNGLYMASVHALCLFAPFTFTWDAFGVGVLLYFITGMLGITLSYHRHLAHKSFTVPKWLEYTLAYCAVLAIQGTPIEWVSNHRLHHKYCDTELDPHTPYEGLWHSHLGWFLDSSVTKARVAGRLKLVPEMTSDPFYTFIQNTYPYHMVGSALLLYALGGFPYLIWAFAVRIVFLYHVTWFVNSASHVWGFQSWNTGDLSRNNWWVGILAFGEGWHNNHHAFEYSCRHGLRWWQFDPTWYTVKLLEAVGLATNLRYPTPDHMARLTFTEEKAV